MPVFLDYQGHPGGWIRKFPFALQCFIVICTFPLWRRPLKVTVGAPLLASELAEGRRLAAAQLRHHVIDLAQEGKTAPSDRTSETVAVRGGDAASFAYDDMRCFLP